MLQSGAQGWDGMWVFALENGGRTALCFGFVILLEVSQESKQVNWNGTTAQFPCVPARLHRADWSRNGQLAAWSLELLF